MILGLAGLSQPWLRRLEPEVAHRAAITALKLAGGLPARARPPDDRLRVKIFGLDFPNPLGLAAGFDKSAEAAAGLLKLGFGFVELGTLTPRPQAGHPKPRLFRLSEDRAIVNRMGFNNDGFAVARERLERARPAGIVGVNFGPNKDASDRVADFALGAKTFAPLADYLTINISSPNTAGLRDLQRREALDGLIARVAEARDAAPKRRPLLVKIAPDLDLRELDDVCAVAIKRGADGLIISNTTILRPSGLVSSEASESGGLSGPPLFSLSTRLLARAFLRCEGALKLIGCGGIEDTEGALAKIEAGADMLQVYTGFVYRGPRLIAEILDGLAEFLHGRPLSEFVGAKARDYAVGAPD